MSSPYATDDVVLSKLCNYLRSSNGPPVREAVMREKRVQYIKGPKLVTFLSDGGGKSKKKWPKGCQKFPDRTDAINFCKLLLEKEYIVRVEKQAKGALELSPIKDFTDTEDGLYVWLFEGDKSYSNVMTGVMIAAFLACCMFPIWPSFVKVWIWYLSCTILVVTFVVIFVRLVVFIAVWIFGYDLWILPNLFDEGLGVAESFIPLVTFYKSENTTALFRLAVLGAFAGFFYWAVTQPTEFDGMIKAQSSFLEDLYSGNLLTDMSQQSKDDIDKPKVKSLDDLLQELDAVDVEEEDAQEAILDHLLEEDEQ
jgi:translocation protein SEC62